ncbi:hypothetical protein DUNSADRAFT_7892 [Dunaliella salina]|uniref:Uncharacterized protein n=1 Tax=Dunaliella salina TaxID=3046 RepID=A0ABQ7GKD8_DUNSA|nr:hypothetical protein DUNSADRAFT_7892 [Dunaliella salina]|eukprot:KAF5835086.1 hypothetical protein DUNSADRAFT_7892 [Dunaliella salina]
MVMDGTLEAKNSLLHHLSCGAIVHVYSLSFFLLGSLCIVSCLKQRSVQEYVFSILMYQILLDANVCIG